VKKDGENTKVRKDEVRKKWKARTGLESRAYLVTGAQNDESLARGKGAVGTIAEGEGRGERTD